MGGRQFTLSEDFDRPVRQGAIERQSYSRGFKCVAGVDEVGRGPLAGPVVAAAVVLPQGFTHCDIKDSKVLTSEQRESLLPTIRESALCWGVGVVEVEEIDRINILQASLLAMGKAFRALRPVPDCLLIDGNQKIPVEFFQTNAVLKQLPFQRTIIKGDQLCVSIAAASILAKVARDAMMMELDKSYPEYGFAHHKGYSCFPHMEALRRFGPSPIHRRSFKPVRAMCAVEIETDLDLPFVNP
ncbi:MAG TPA: ribonuclease HII [Candidatus Polarisedimenticolaceae bacterium]|nr:ribonuclease HII [Candidatus Polarisedimenticolaceae bacterium]